MDAVKDQKPSLLKKESDNNSKEKNIYDLIHSEELDILYKKNAHLLSRLSKTGKENTKLYTQLYSINKEKKNLGDKNTVLENKFLGLKKQISLFARQHREFSIQSRQLKEDLKKTESIQIQENPTASTETKTLKKIKLLEKKELVYTKQIQNLQNLSKKEKEENHAQLKNLGEDHKKAILLLENKLQNFYQNLKKEKNKTKNQQSFSAQKVKVINQKLNKRIKNLDTELKSKDKAYKLLLEKIEKKSKSFNKDEKHQVWHTEKVKTIKKQFEEKLKALNEHYKKERELLKNQKHTKKYKDKINELIKQSEKSKSQFVEQLNLFSKERDVLKFQCTNLKKALSAGKAGFDQAMLSFQKKYKELYKNQKNLQEQMKEKSNQIQILEKKLARSQQNFLTEKEEIKSRIEINKNGQIKKLNGELEAFKDQNKYLEDQVQKFKKSAEQLFLKEKRQLKEEITNLKWSKEQNLIQIEENHKKEKEEIENNHTARIKNLEDSLNKKFQHIYTEMENDLCSEKKRYEIFKNMKEKQVQELQNNLSLLQSQSHEWKTKNIILEKSLSETRNNLNINIKNNQRWKEKNENLRSLWQELHKQNETKDQQIKSLQKLNRSLSLSLNEKKDYNDFSALNRGTVEELKNQESEGEGESKKSPNHILADLHFD